LSIERWRKEIDAIDEQLVRLLNERSKCAIELGRIKRESGLPIYSPDREKDVIQHVTGVNRGPLDAAAMRRLFERIIDESRSIERVIVEREEGEQEQASQRKNANRKKKTR